MKANGISWISAQLTGQEPETARTTDAYARIYTIVRMLVGKGAVSPKRAAEICCEPVSRMQMYLRAAYAMGYANRWSDAEGFIYEVMNAEQAAAKERKQQALKEFERVRKEVTA